MPLKLLEIFRFELDFRMRRPATWLLLLIFVGLSFFAAKGLLIDEAQRAGDLYANGPAGIAVTHVFVSMIGMIVSAALFSGAALRDLETRMHPLFATSPITKTDYLGGRFAGALLVNLLLATVVPFALMVALRPELVSPELLGPFRAASFVQPYLFLLLPNIFFTGTVLFAVAVLTRRSLPVFATAVVLFIGGLLVEEIVAEQLGRGGLASLLDPFGFTALSELWEFWTTHERNTQPVRFEGSLVWNRLLWFGAGVLVLAFTRYRFRMDLYEARGRRRGAKVVVEEEASVPVRLDAIPVAPSFGPGTRLRQMLSVARESFRALVLTRDFLLISVALFILVLLVGQTMSDNFGVPFWPLTQFIAPLLGGFFPAMAISLLTAFYAGELVWRERDNGLADIADANPVPGWALFAGKFAALALMLTALQGVMMLSGMLLQAFAGYFRFEPALYLKIVFGLQLTEYLLLAALAMLVHVLVNNKYFGHLLVVLCYLFMVFGRRFGIAHNLLLYGGDGGWVYSDVSGFGPFMEAVVWFRLYWTGWAVLFAVLASLLWIRGRDRGLRKRLRLVRLRFNRGAALATAAAVLLIVSVGGYIYYNTNVLAGYLTPYAAGELRAEYERRYGKFERAAQPTVRGTKLHVELYPERRVVDVRGTYTLLNATAQPIRAVHLFLNPEVENRAVSFDRPSRVAIADDKLGHRTYELASALAPGESLEMQFALRFAPRGFPNNDPNTSVVRNGTYFDHNGGRRTNHRRWFPLVGYQPTRELSAARARREHGLPPRPLARSLDEASSVHDSAGRESITFEAVIGTDAKQLAVAPGTLRRTWMQNGRRYFHYAHDRTVKNSFAIFSADYAVHRELWNDVQIELFHHPTHTFNVPRFARSARASLDYYTKNFGPYPHKHVRIAQFPRYANLAHAYPGTISYAETTGWLTRIDESRHFDLASMTVAHEIAHQWWGFQVMPAAVEGGPTIAEVLSQYSALMVVEKIYGPEMVRRFLYNTRIEYLNRRGRPEHPEVPLLRVTDHANLVYRKGPLAMYALRYYIGEEQLNAALRRLVEKHGSGEPPYATTRDLYRELKLATPPEYHYLLEDFLETITLWRLRTTAVTATPAANGTWRVTMDVDAHKLRADGSGKETEVPMHDFVDIGVFGPTTNVNELGEELYLQKHRIRSGAQRITLTVKGKPGKVGIDPHLHLIDRNWMDNVRRISGVK
ncbi:MAG TPA: M1 family aminopeptidase [Thermoanaerobaculia bacterium]